MKKILLLICLFITACSPVQPTPADTGIEGQVFIGPMCPVVREGEACPDQPYQATLTILRPDGREVTRFETDEEGRFRVALRPAKYILHPETPEGMPLPYAGEQEFSVQAGQYTQLTITYDSGIR
jgi:hypothetical protein